MWNELLFKLTSDAPLIMHSSQTADPLNRFAKMLKQISAKRGKTDADFLRMAEIEFMAALYVSDAGRIIIPAMNFDAMLQAAAKKTKEGMLCKSGLYCKGEMLLEYDGERDPKNLWENERFRFSVPVRVGMARVMRMRPIFKQWRGDVTICYEDSVVNPARVKEWMRTAGLLVGLGDWRPQYGRFDAHCLT